MCTGLGTAGRGVLVQPLPAYPGNGLGDERGQPMEEAAAAGDARLPRGHSGRDRR